MKHKHTISKAQLEVWEWKEKAAESLLALPPEEWLRVVNARTLSAQMTIQKRRAKKATARKQHVPV